jgi:hypothetical protein
MSYLDVEKKSEPYDLFVFAINAEQTKEARKRKTFIQWTHTLKMTSRKVKLSLKMRFVGSKS